MKKSQSIFINILQKRAAQKENNSIHLKSSTPGKAGSNESASEGSSSYQGCSCQTSPEVSVSAEASAAATVIVVVLAGVVVVVGATVVTPTPLRLRAPLLPMLDISVDSINK